MADALRSLRDALDAHGLLPQHDGELVCATSIIAGRHIHGSWWGDPAGGLIFDVLTTIEDEVASVKILDGKVTLVHRRLFPALAAIGLAARADLRRDAAHLLVRVKKEGYLRTDDVELPSGSRKPGAVANELEKHMLVYSRQEHTESGHHARQLLTWEKFLREHGIEETPDEREARRLFDAAADGIGALERLPWNRRSPKKAAPKPRKTLAKKGSRKRE
jgi:hypothetical protein